MSGTLEHTAQMANIINKARIKQRSLVITLLDLKNAFGEVHHNLITSVLDYHHIPEHIKLIIKSLYTDFKTSIITSEFRTPFIPVRRGVLQGHCPSPLLFNMCFNTFIQHIKTAKYRQFGFSIQFLNPIHWFQFADEAAVISSQESENQHLLNRFSVWCQWSNMIIRVDKCSTFGIKGTLIAIKHGIFISCSQITSIATTNLEAVAIQCTLPNHAKWLLVCCYRPPDSNDMSDLRSFADNLFPSYDKIIIAGDFNLPNISWTDGNYTSSGSLSQNFCDILDDYFMSQLCLTPTRESNILDLLITNQPEQVSFIDICSPTDLGMSSDHKIIQFKFSSASKTIQSNKRLVYDYRRANFDGLRKRLIDIDICSLVTNNGTESSVDDDWSTWKDAVMTAVHEFIPSKYVDPRRSPPWITPTILHQIIVKRLLPVRDSLAVELIILRRSSTN